MELRVRGDRAVLVDPDGTATREADPDTIAIGADLAAALHEWARAASALRGDSVGATVVSRRGRQLAERVSRVMGVPVRYVDPFSGEGEWVSVTVPRRAAVAVPAEPVPWATGLVVSGFTFVVVMFAIVTLAGTLRATSPLLSVASNVVVTAGLLPSVWLARGVRVWRWVAYGVFGGIVVGWIALPFVLL